MSNLITEKELQESFEFERAQHFKTYNAILAYYQALTCIEHVQGSSILDLPCGDGYVTEIFSNHYTHVVGVDASSKHLEMAKQRLPHIEFHESLIEEFHTEDRFDGVFMLNILEHVINPVQVIQKAASFLKEQGKLIIQVPNSEAINRHIAVKMGSLMSLDELSPWDLQVAGHRRYYNLDSLVSDIHAAGLKVEFTGGVFYKMLSTAQFDWFLDNGKWEGNVFGWGRTDGEMKNWKEEFCKACYEIGKERPRDCNLIYAVITR